MGLDFSHCDAHWSYSGFGRFRARLAAGIGVRLGKMEGFGGSGSWDEVDDPIKALLHHSDCDGELTAEECALVYPRLEELVSGWLGSNEEEDYDRHMGLELVEGMKKAVILLESLEFC